jgi:hypothetical protein
MSHALLDYSRITGGRFGNGTVGAKTAQLDKWKVHMKAG